MSMRDAIRTILLANGRVACSYKVSIDGWMDEVSISRLYLHGMKSGDYCVSNPYYGTQYFENIEVAIGLYIGMVFNKKNLALSIKGIIRRKMTTKDLDDLDKKEIKELVKEYNKKYFDLDYPPELIK